MPWTLVLGNNRIFDCDTALIVEGEEVFRLRERDRDGNLVVDFDLRTTGGRHIAKITKNQVAHAAPGYKFRSRTGVAQVVNETTGDVAARVEQQGPDTVAVTGTFHVKGYTVEITPDRLVVGGLEMAGNEIHGHGKAIVLRRDFIGIGGAQFTYSIPRLGQHTAGRALLISDVLDFQETETAMDAAHRQLDEACTKTAPWRR